MVKYKFGKTQVKRLLNGNFVVDGRGRKYYASEGVKEILELIDKHDLYDKYDILAENGMLDVIKKS